jgi:hypothetical protein
MKLILIEFGNITIRERSANDWGKGFSKENKDMFEESKR